MAEQRYDKLGRRIPDLDRSAIVRKSEATKKEKYGTDYHQRIGARGGSRPKRGYFGKLKDEGKTDELKKLAQKGAAESNATRRTRNSESEVRGPESSGAGGKGARSSGNGTTS